MRIGAAALVVLMIVLGSLSASADSARRRAMWPAAGGGPYTFTYVGSASGATDGSSNTVVANSASIAVQSGDLIIVAVQWEDGVGTEEVSSIVDDNSTNPVSTKDSEIHNSGFQMNLHTWWGLANTTRTVTSWTATLDADMVFKKMAVMVYRKSGGTISKDISGTPAIADDTNTSSTVVTGTFSTTGANNVVCAMAGFYTSGTWSAHTINSVADDRVLEPAGISMWCRDNVSALSSVTAGASYNTTRYWVANAIAFKAE